VLIYSHIKQNNLQLYSEPKRAKLYRGASLKINDNRQSMTDSSRLVEQCDNTVKRLGHHPNRSNQSKLKDGSLSLVTDDETKNL